MTYLPTQPVSAVATLSDTDTFPVVQAGVTRTATLAMLKAYAASAGSSASRLVLRDGSLLVLRDGSHLALR